MVTLYAQGSPPDPLTPEKIPAISTRRRKLGSAAILLALFGFAVFFFLRGTILPHRAYEDIYTLVPDKISQSAAIVVRLPEGVTVDVTEAKEKILFDPQLSGTWSSDAHTASLVFRPDKKLKVGTYYSVTLATATIKLKKDFLADEDPRIISIFPDANSETSEYSNITIVFNRPMVPLTTLDTLASKDIPVEITPATSGTYRWITTRNLQFIPEKRLVRSAHYTVAIKSGFISMDGLAVEPTSHQFTTRPLRYQEDPQGNEQLIYNQPLRFIFNQPIDIARTAKELALQKNSGERVEIIAAYGMRSVYDPKTQKSTDFLDKSILEIYDRADRHGRAKFWDFNMGYRYKLARAFPLEGDQDLSEERNGLFATSDVISDSSTDSPRSQFTKPDLFDPQGKLKIGFFEDIDKDASRISGDNIRDISYGEKCKEPAPGEDVRTDDQCPKVPDQKQLLITFTPDGLARGQTVQIHFKKIYNRAGQQINAEEIIKTIKLYPNLVIYKTLPAEGAQQTGLTQMKICTSNPLQVPDEKTFYDRVKSNVTVGLWNWHEPHRIQPGDREATCSAGQFENTIEYGLIPEFAYTITLRLNDDFGQTIQKSVHFTSGKLPAFSRNLFSLQKQYNVTSPERTKLAYGVDNLEYVNMHICAVSPETMLHYLENRPDQTASPSTFDCTRTIEKRINLPKRYWSRIYFQINLADYLSDPIGQYIVSLGHPDYRRVYQERNPQTDQTVERVGERIYNRTFVTVTRLAVQEKKIQWENASYESNREVVSQALAKSPRNLYWISQFGSLEPVADARVELYQSDIPEQNQDTPVKNVRLVDTAHTGTDGVALAAATPRLAAAIIKKGNDSAIVAEDFDRIQWSSQAQAVERTYLYTDKPIYRPGQRVMIKGIYRLGYDAKYETLPDRSVNIEIRNSAYEKIAQKKLTLNNYGTFTTDFTLDEHAPLGTYSISSPGGSVYFDVEEYVPAAFKVSAKSDKEEYSAGDTLHMDIDAAYYFGVPVDGGSVEYDITSQDYYFDRYTDGYFQFGRGWYYSYDGGYGDKFIARGKASLDAHGHAEISRVLDFNSFFKEDEVNRSKIFTVTITAKNRNGQSISTRKSVIVHRGTFYTGISLDNNFVGKNEKIVARVKTVDIHGKEVSQGGIALEVKKITWESYKRQEVDGNYYSRTEQKKETVQKFTLSTDLHGDASRTFSLPSEGEYEVVVSGKDATGNPISATQDLFIYGEGAVTIRPTNNETLDLATDKNQVDVGEQVKIIIKSPYPHAKALVSLERGTLFDYRIIDINQSLTDYTFSVKDEYVPNVYASVLLLSPRPEIKFGQINYTVNTKQRELAVDIHSDKNNYLPGEKVNLDITVHDSNGAPVSGELSLAVVDMSVLALKGNPKKNPVLFFYNGSPLTVSTQSNIKNILYEADIPTGTKGGGGGNEELDRKKRGEFKDTALWQGVVQTDPAGKAHTSFTLPDNLTTWQIESVAVTKDTKLGVGYREFQTAKRLMAIPLKPRFIVPGDEFSIGGQIFNNTDERQRVDVSISSDTLKLTGEKTTSLSLEPHTDKTVYFPVRAPEDMQDGKHTFILSAKSNGLEDTVEDSFSITRNDTYESVATAGYTSEAETREYVYLPPNVTPDRGGLMVKSSATLSVFLSDALNYLVQYPYGCSEQIASKLSSLAILKRGLSLKNIGDAFTLKGVEFEGRTYSPDDVARIGLARLYENQTTEGGFAYYKSMKPDLYLTMHIIGTLTDLKNAGYTVDTDKTEAAMRYLYHELTTKAYLAQDKDLVILAAYTLSRIDNSPAVVGAIAATDLKNRIIAIARDARFINETGSNETLAYLAILLSKDYPPELKEKVFQALENRIVIDSRGAFLSLQGRGPRYAYYETPIKDTALLLKAFARDERDSKILDKVLRWILASRAKDGAWGSTNNTVTVLDALTDFLVWKKENLSSFKLALSLDTHQIDSFTFTKDTILRQLEKFIPASDLGLGKIRTLLFSKTNQNNEPNNYYYDMVLKYYLPIEKIPPRDEGFSVSREFYDTDDKANAKPVLQAKQGDVLRGHLVITVPEARDLVSIEDFIPAGMELVNLKLDTENQALQTPDDTQSSQETAPHMTTTYTQPRSVASAHRTFWESSIASIASWFNSSSDTPLISFGKAAELADDLYGDREMSVQQLVPDSNESHDDRLFLFKEHLAPGVYEYDYFVRALIPGTYHHLPAVASELYFPENFGRTRGEIFPILQNK